MDYNIEYIFPKSIFVADNVCKEMLPNFAKEIDAIFNSYGSHRNEVLNVDSTHTSYDNIHTLPVFKPLVDKIFFCLQEYVKEMGYDNHFYNKLYISNMWANKSNVGDLLEDHVHQSCIFSGSFYVDSSSDSRIIFKDFTNMLPLPTTFTPSSIRHRWYETLPGRLILFRSDMPHSTNKQTSQSRTIISFNIKERNDV